MVANPCMGAFCLLAELFLSLILGFIAAFRVDRPQPGLVAALGRCRGGPRGRGAGSGMTSRRHTPPGTAPRNARQQGPQHPPPPAPIRLRAGRRLRARCVLSVRKSIRVFRLRTGRTNAMVTVVQWALAPTRGGNGPCRQRAREGAEVIHPEIYIRYAPSKIYTVYVLKFLKKTCSCGWVPFFFLSHQRLLIGRRM